MSHAIQVRSVPDDVHRELRRQAEIAGVSLTEFLRGELIRIARRPAIPEVLARAASQPGGAPLDRAVATIRADRDAH